MCTCYERAPTDPAVFWVWKSGNLAAGTSLIEMQQAWKCCWQLLCVSFSFPFAYGIEASSNWWCNAKDETCPYGDADLSILTCGNSGVGKSFIDNIILGSNVFDHSNIYTSVTRTMEVQMTDINGRSAAVYNLPGLVEANTNNWNDNKNEIMKSFEQSRNQVVVFVFGLGNGGRIRGEDVAAFESLNKAYNFNKHSLITVLNNFDIMNADKDYKVNSILYLRELLDWPPEQKLSIVFIEKLPNTTAEAVQNSETVYAIRQQLFKSIDEAVPYAHKKAADIVYTAELVQQAKTKLSQLIADLTNLRAKHANELQSLKVQIEQEHKKHLADQAYFNNLVADKLAESRTTKTKKKKRGLYFFGFKLCC